MEMIEWIFIGLIGAIILFGLNFLIRECLDQYFCRNCYKLKPRSKWGDEEPYCSKECWKGE